IARFAAMLPGDRPFILVANWTQLDDSLAYDGSGYGGLRADLTVNNAVLAMGFSITGQTNGPDVQHQLEIYPNDDSGTLTEVGLNATGAANVPDAVIGYFDGATYPIYQSTPTA